jgi:hypothetical protein
MIEIKGDTGEQVLIEVDGRLNVNAVNDLDADFLKGSIRANVTGFTAFFGFVTRSSEIEYWIQQLAELYYLKINHLHLITIEEHLSIKLQIDELGKVFWNVELKYSDENKNKLIICFTNGMSDIELFSRGLKNILLTLPVPSSLQTK